MVSILIKNIRFDLSEKGIQRAIDQVNEIKDRIVPAMHKLIDWLTERGVDIAQINIMSFDEPPYYYGDLYNSIESVPIDDNGAGYVVANCWYAMYVEFGTGTGFNKENEFGVGRSGEPEHAENGWMYFNERDGRWHFTYGMAARPFMQMTYHDLIDQAQRFGGRIVAEYLANGGL